MPRKNGKQDASDAAENLERTIDDARERLDDVTKRLGEGAETARKGISKRLAEAASAIRTELDKADELDDDAREQANKLIDRLNSASKYLEAHNLDEIEDDAREVVTENPWRAILIAFVFGLVIGMLLRGGQKD